MQTFEEFTEQSQQRDHVRAVDRAITQIEISMSDLHQKYGYDTRPLLSMIGSFKINWQDVMDQILKDVRPPGI